MNWKFFPHPFLAMAVGAILAPFTPVSASTFTETAIDQTEVIAVARPYGVETTKYDLLVIEQIPGKNKCWDVTPGAPAMVDPLLLNFDFTGHCRRATDSNGYSIRIDGQDYGLDYLLRLVPRGNELVLVATSRNGRGPELVVGSTKGIGAGFMQVQLNPGWQFTKRTYEGQVLGHYYISGTQAAILGGTAVSPVGPEPITPEKQELIAPEPVQTLENNPNPTPTEVTETGTEIIIKQEVPEVPANEQSGMVMEEESVSTVTEENSVAKEMETVTPKPALVVKPNPPRRRTPTPADFRP
ncbi:sll0319 [Synechocystis sp. PCC 6803]|uniref:Sll0319 protein n=2 Tax=Synechocystis TaxID=1142 RepID=P74789_SYNY3|nr:DUF3747 domain-containing protein [Synechocystis sp. PCC 6803]AVP90225.1 DUF3747 domain-containing protein [Synechocystis sp. IPPAS B-1465]MBD2619110.1 DUF3747 domain-containing protein [Synechocystis sp. FACHB-898]MBD2639496.1 DUF3747 domain-containing protein [Synechocystis sp. FACHB-908]MBD2661859.1 DUF3747 domain-containing protein [Synechocystis sp. FACHB-929]BAL29939.1 hypothetical protein SYNGTI_2192 [Synechocystis sp. PCC 6803 substr. GT-I]BAL33108.1 hypothetical protein SYNPCCN_21